LDSHARLIGMNTAIASKTGQSAGVGFALPVGTIARIVPQLIQHGHVIRATIGITRVLESEHGLVVVSVAAGGPAETAGIQGFRLVRQRRQRGPYIEETQRIDRSSADLIVAVDGQKVLSLEQFLSLIEAKKPGQPVELTVVRETGQVKIKVALAAAES
jgi:S1-C subfamily serine protease